MCSQVAGSSASGDGLGPGGSRQRREPEIFMEPAERFAIVRVSLGDGSA